MAKEIEIWEIVKNAGYEPVENKTIIVKYAPDNLSEKTSYVNKSRVFGSVRCYRFFYCPKTVGF